jgi:UDP-glucose 4-epimerase
VRFIATGRNGSIGKLLPNSLPIFSRAESNPSETFAELESLNCKTLIHLAGISNTNEVVKDEARAIDVNLEWPLRLLDQFVAVGGETFVFVSSSHVYGARHIGIACKESSGINPVSRYGALKAEAELALSSSAKRHNIRFTSIRLFSVFGPGMAGHYLASRVQRVLEGVEEPSMVQNSEDVRDFSTPARVATQIEEIAGMCERGIMPEVVNLGSGSGMSVREKILREAPFWPSALFDGQMSEVPYLVADLSRLKSMRHIEQKPIL